MTNGEEETCPHGRDPAECEECKEEKEREKLEGFGKIAEQETKKRLVKEGAKAAQAAGRNLVNLARAAWAGIVALGPGGWAAIGIIILCIIAAIILFAVLGVGFSEGPGGTPAQQAQARTQSTVLALANVVEEIRKGNLEAVNKALGYLNNLEKEVQKDSETYNQIQEAKALLERLKTLSASESDAQRKEVANKAANLLRKIIDGFPIVTVYVPRSASLDGLLSLKASDITKLVVKKKERRLYFYQGDKIVADAPINIGHGRPTGPPNNPLKGQVFDPYGDEKRPGSNVTPKGKYKTESGRYCPGGCFSKEFKSNMGPITISIKNPSDPNDPINGRGILFHGRDPAKETEKLSPTAGCIRVYNRDLQATAPYMENKIVEIY